MLNMNVEIISLGRASILDVTGNTYIKRCGKCKEWQIGSTFNFNNDKSRSDGLYAVCIGCQHAKELSKIQAQGKTPQRYGGKVHQVPDGFKRCSRCKDVFEAKDEYFTSNKSAKDGLSHRCRSCITDHRKRNPKLYSDYDHRWYLNNPEKIKQKREKWINNLSLSQKESMRLSKLKANLKRKAAQDLLLKDYDSSDIHQLMQKQDYQCIWCSKNIATEPSIDHFVPLAKGGYDCIDNLVISCRSCNFSKRDKMPWYFNSKNITPFGVNKINKYLPVVTQ